MIIDRNLIKIKLKNYLRSFFIIISILSFSERRPDKSATIDKSLLNIKDNSEVEYNAFTNVNKKLVLKDDCNAGNNKSHSIYLRLKGSQAHKTDVYKTVIKLEAEQK